MHATLENAIPDRHMENLHRLESGYWWYVGRLEWAKRLITRYRKSPVSSHADIGCGTSGFARELRSRLSIKETALVDAHPGALRHLSAEKGVTVIAADITMDFDLPFQPSVISLMDVIEHVVDDATLVARMAKKLPKGGQLLISVPAHQFLYSEWDRLLGHHRRYNASQLRSVVERAGLRVLQTRYMWSFLFPLGPWRKIRPAKQSKLEFPPVPDFANRLLISLSRLEWAVSRVIPFPFGTSLILIAEKP